MKYTLKPYRGIAAGPGEKEHARRGVTSLHHLEPDAVFGPSGENTAGVRRSTHSSSDFADTKGIRDWRRQAESIENTRALSGGYRSKCSIYGYMRRKGGREVPEGREVSHLAEGVVADDFQPELPLSRARGLHLPSSK
ncbi:unnamed protein product [Ectocarpus sp. 12 AP-2014]